MKKLFLIIICPLFLQSMEEEPAQKLMTVEGVRKKLINYDCQQIIAGHEHAVDYLTKLTQQKHPNKQELQIYIERLNSDLNEMKTYVAFDDEDPCFFYGYAPFLPQIYNTILQAALNNKTDLKSISPAFISSMHTTLQSGNRLSNPPVHQVLACLLCRLVSFTQNNNQLIQESVTKYNQLITFTQKIVTFVGNNPHLFNGI